MTYLKFPFPWHTTVMKRFPDLLVFTNQAYILQATQHTRPSISLSSSMSPSMDNLLWSPMASLNGDVVEKDDHWQWSVEEVNFLQTIML